MCPEDIILAKFGDLKLVHVGNLKVNKEELSMHVARVKINNGMPYNLFMTLSKPSSDKIKLSDCKWKSVYLRSYFNLKMLQDMFPLNWQRVIDLPEQIAAYGETPSGCWIKEVPEKTVRGAKTKYYLFQNPDYIQKYVVSLETRLKNVDILTGLKSEYEFDLILAFTSNNVSIEKLVN